MHRGDLACPHSVSSSGPGQYREFLKKCEVMRVILDSEILFDDGLDKKLLKACEKGDIDEAVTVLTHGVGVNATCNEREWTPLLIAAQAGKLEMVEFLLSNYHANVNQRDYVGCTPLIVAALSGHLHVVEILLAHNADTEIIAYTGMSALSAACDKNHLDIAETLLHHGALPDTHKKGYWTPLMYVVGLKQEHLSMVELLLNAGAFVNKVVTGMCPLILACDSGHINIVKLLLSRGADVNIWGKVMAGFVWTPLAVSARRGYHQICRMLLDHGAMVEMPPEAEGDSGTPLMFACSEGMEVAKLLLEHGADVHARRKDGITPMHCCCYMGHLDIVKMLQSHGAALDAVSENGITPLMSACKNGHVSVVQYLLENSPSLLNMQCQSGWSSLMFACDGGHSAVVAELLSHGADVEQHIFASGASALMVATSQGHLETVKLLLEANASVNYRNKLGWTALFLAAEKGDLAITKRLMKYGADLSLTAMDNVTAYDIARMHNQKGVCEELETCGYQPSSPPIKGRAGAVHLSPHVLTQQNFLDMGNMHTFREVLQHEGQSDTRRANSSFLDMENMRTLREVLQHREQSDTRRANSSHQQSSFTIEHDLTKHT